MAEPSSTRRGRPRDQAIAACVLDAALAELGAKGYSAFSLTSVADAAGTTRPAIYRRWNDKDELIVDAVAHLAATDPPETTGDHFVDLVNEVDDFRHCIQAAGALPLAGVMLGDSVDPAVRAAYVERVVTPRRTRIRAILDAAVAAGDLPANADLDVATTFITGSWYSYRVADRNAPADWPRRVATLIWNACGGTPPANLAGVGRRRGRRR